MRHMIDNFIPYRTMYWKKILYVKNIFYLFYLILIFFCLIFKPIEDSPKLPVTQISSLILAPVLVKIFLFPFGTKPKKLQEIVFIKMLEVIFLKVLIY